jgi:hypothetical protein
MLGFLVLKKKEWILFFFQQNCFFFKKKNPINLKNEWSMLVRNIQIESSLSEFMSGNTLPTTI